MYDLSKLKESLDYSICKVFENERNFIVHFFKDFEGYEISGFFMASGMCVVRLEDGVGNIEENYIYTDHFIDWLIELEDKNEN